MLVIKCDENEQSYNRLRNAINFGELDNADRIISSLQASNGASLQDLQNEVADGPNLISLIGQLTQQLLKEIREQNQSRGRSASRGRTNLRASRDDGRSQSPLRRSALKSNSMNRDLAESFTAADKNDQMRRRLMDL